MGDKVRVTIQILLADDKRLHLAHEMFRLDDGERAATQELLFLPRRSPARAGSARFRPELQARGLTPRRPRMLAAASA